MSPLTYKSSHSFSTTNNWPIHQTTKWVTYVTGNNEQEHEVKYKKSSYNFKPDYISNLNWLRLLGNQLQSNFT